MAARARCAVAGQAVSGEVADPVGAFGRVVSGRAVPSHAGIPRNEAFVEQIRQFVNSLAERLVEVDLVDRAVALGSQAFVALIPLLIVTAAFLPRSNRGGFAVALIERFELKGASAAAVERVFAQPASVRTSPCSALLLVVSGLSSAARSSLYERTWRLPALGIAPRRRTFAGSPS